MFRLCSRCTIIIDSAFRREYYGEAGHHHSFSGLKEAVDARCYLCNRLWKNIENHWPGLLSPQSSGNSFEINIMFCIRPAIAEFTHQPTGIEAIDIQLFLEGTHPGEYCTVLPTDIMAQQYLAPFAQPDATKERATIEQARQWLSVCISSHKSCCRIRSECLPTRLVGIGMTDGRICARVCDSTDVVPRSQYLTLSHMWGKSFFLTLKKDNIEQLKQSIPTNDLPEVFQDAIAITHALGYSYLWIDSLCIIQDSDGGADWLRECPRMNQVYGNSVCNLAATGFDSGQEGLFPACQTEEILPLRFERHSPNKDKTDGSYYIISSSEWAVDVNRAPLHFRGWVFQEQIMAPRILHFTKKQVYWECYSSKASEVFPTGFPPYGLSIDNLKNKILVSSTLSRDSDKDDLYQEWLNLVQEYSRANLTFPKDKLPALSGLAKAFSNRLQDEYLAGLWRNDLIRGLLWHGTLHTKTLATYRAPSWSWASIDGLFVCADRDVAAAGWKSPANIISAEITPLDAEDITGQVVDGSIRISCPLREITITGNLKKHSFRFNFKSPFTPGTRDATARQAIVYCCGDYDLGTLSIYLSVADWLPLKKVFLMLLLVHDNLYGGGCRAYGLVLSPAGAARGEYVKVGTFQIRCQETLQGLFFENHVLDEQYYEAYDGEHQYTIRIV